MKSRILNSLFEFSKPTVHDSYLPMFNDITVELQIEPEKLRQRARATLKDILHNYAFFDISTIDKFTHRLIRTFAKDLKLPQNFDVVLDTKLLLDEAISKLLNKAGNDEELTNILIAFALEKADDNKSWDITFDLNKIGLLLFEETNQFHLKKIENKKTSDFIELQKSLKKKIEDHEKKIVSFAREGLHIIEENRLEFNDFNSGYFPKFLDKIAKENLTIDFKAGWKQNFEVNPLYSSKCDGRIKSILDGLHSQFISIFNEIKARTLARKMLQNIYKNIVPLTVLNAIRQEVKAIEAIRNQLHISDFNTIISEEIKDQPAPFIYERLGEKYRHYFIDEFQDTSEMQWKNLSPLIDNALSSNGGSLFLVGDAKQAIYRWRGGKAEQFLNLLNLTANPFVIDPTVEALPANYRSHEEIVKFNNAFFTSTSNVLQNDIYSTLFEKGTEQEVKIKKDGLVELTFLDIENKQLGDNQYCQEVFDTIQKVVNQNYGFGDICVLVRGNKEGVLVADFLTQHEVPVISSESLLLVNNPKVRFLVNLLKLSDQVNSKELSFEILSFLSSNHKNKHDFIADHLSNPIDLLKDDYHFNLEKLRTTSVYDLVEFAIKTFDLAPKSDAHINFFMDVIVEVEQKEGGGTLPFLNYWEKKSDKLSITSPEGINAVQIMTVHKSKGLEFDVLIYPFANSNIHKEIDTKLWLPVNSNDFMGFEEMIITKKQEVEEYSLIAKALYDEEHHKSELDAFNVLYVALTRAVKALYIITKKDLTAKGAHKMNLYSGLFIHYLKEKGIWNDHQNQYSFGKLPKNESQLILNELEKIPYQYTYKDRPSFKIIAQSNLTWDTERGRAISQGNLIHYIMGLIKTHDEVDTALDKALKAGEINKDEIDPTKVAILQIINHPELRKYFHADMAVFNEKDIITENGTILRPDRIAIKANKASIIDYKTGKKDSRYKEQIYAYADALQDMGYEIENKIIVYVNEEIKPVLV